MQMSNNIRDEKMAVLGKKKAFPYTQNRELSWLQFNHRVLEEASDPRVPLLERIKFLSIFTSNLDEFFMVRCGSLYDVSLVDPDKRDSRSGMTSKEQLDAIFEECIGLYAKRDEVYKNINQTLFALHMSCLEKKQMSKKQIQAMNGFFDTQVFPVLSPQIVDVHHPFPHLLNKELYVIVQVSEEGKKRFGIVPVPSFVDRIYYLPQSDGDYTLLEKIMYHNVEKVFPMMDIKAKAIVRITRNADINLDEGQLDEDDDYRQYMKKILKKRSRLAPIRLEFYKYSNEEIIDYLCDRLDIEKSQVFVSKTPLDMSYVFSIIDHYPSSNTKPLLYEDFKPQPTPELDLKRSIIDQVLHKDIMLFYPYQDIEAFLLLLREAASDDRVVSIKITIYRLAKQSRILRYLVRAAENGKDVTVLMELRARFDEHNNIQAAEALEEAGCTVLYGFEDYKVHSKICLITMKTKKEIRTITQIGTGNYNEKTSRMYTDISYITASSKIGKDAVVFFQNMALSNLEGHYEHLIVSPVSLKSTSLALMDREIKKAKEGYPARIYLKMNSMTDVKIIEKLKEASCAGVDVCMVIRGICCILPEVKGYTENVHVMSIVGRFLEHSRIYCFGNDVYISSADYMTRNTEKRVEIGCPIYDEEIKKRVMDYFDRCLRDNVKGRVLRSDGRYHRIEVTDEIHDSQKECMELAIQVSKMARYTEPPRFKSLLSKFFNK